MKDKLEGLFWAGVIAAAVAALVMFLGLATGTLPRGFLNWLLGFVR